jgi:PAS domain-containing protein
VKILTNPILLRAAVVFCCSTFAFLMGLLFMRKLRQSIEEEANVSSEGATSLETLPLHLYNTVIQQLKQQKHELQVQTQAEQHRARTTENFSHAVLSNLSSGVLVFGVNGLVKTTNQAGKDILGFASPTGMSAEDIFRGALLTSGSLPAPGILPDESVDEPLALADEVHLVLRENGMGRAVEAEYETPAGEQRHIAVTVSPIPAADGSLLGAACLINDVSEFERLRRERELHSEISTEMALKLRTSLSTISSYAQQLAQNHDAATAQQLAADIAEEAAQIERSVGAFLTERQVPQSAAAAAGSLET